MAHDGFPYADENTPGNFAYKPAAPRIHPAPPPFPTEKGLQFYAKDSDGQWFYVNHGGTWQACPPPFVR